MSLEHGPTYRDLSHPIETGMTTFPGDPEVAVSPAATVEADGFAVHEVCCGTHTGTHVDAPSHTEPDGGDVDDREVGDYVFEARLVDVAPCAPREAIGPDRLPDRLGDAIDLVVIRTGWDATWNTDGYVNHPYLTAGAARRLRDAGCGVGVDALNPDPTPTEAPGHDTDDEPDGFPVHRVLLGADLPIIENLTRLDGLPERFTLYAFPLPVVGGDGAPVRAVAAVGADP